MISFAAWFWSRTFPKYSHHLLRPHTHILACGSCFHPLPGNTTQTCLNKTTGLEMRRKRRCKIYIYIVLLAWDDQEWGLKNKETKVKPWRTRKLGSHTFQCGVRQMCKGGMSRRRGCKISAAATATKQAAPSFLPTSLFQSKSCSMPSSQILLLLHISLPLYLQLPLFLPVNLWSTFVSCTVLWVPSALAWEVSPCISHAFAAQLCSSLAHFLWLCVELAPPEL